MFTQQSTSQQESPIGPLFIFSKKFPVLPAPGIVFWKWDAALGPICHTPNWRTLLSGEGRVVQAAESWWNRVRNEDLALLSKAVMDCLAGNGPPVDLTVRARRLDKGWGWLLVRGDAVSLEDGQRECIGYTADISRLREDKRLFPRGESLKEKREMPKDLAEALQCLERELLPLDAHATNARSSSPPEEEPYAAILDLEINESLKAFHQQNVATAFATGNVVKETLSLHTSLRGETSGEYCYWPELGPDGKVCAVICQVRDLTEQAHIGYKRRPDIEGASALTWIARAHDASGENLFPFIADQMALLTQSEHSYLFFPSKGEEDASTIHWSSGLRALLRQQESLREDMAPACGLNLPGLANEFRHPRIVNLQNGDAGHMACEHLNLKRYAVFPGFEDGRVVCVAFVCNKGEDYDEMDLRQLELFINGIRLVLRRNRYMQALEKAKDIAEAANRTKDEFLANVSHELRTPLNGMLSMLQLLSLSPLSEEQREYVRTAGISGQALLRILSDILDFSRMESGKLDLRSGMFSLRDTLLSTMDLFTSQARAKGLAVTVSLDEALPASLLGDDARVRQIVFNLVGNAIKFTKRGSVELECSLLPCASRNKVWIYIAVRDTGIGMPPQTHTAVFEPFTQLDSSSTREYSGTGLGLGIVKRLLLLMGGTLTVESEVGEGTTIHCSLPFTRANHNAEENALQQSSFVRSQEQRLDILVAEDDPVGRFALRLFLQRAGHRAVCVETGCQALEALLLHPFDCLLTDIQMPIMDGVETTRRIRQGDSAGITPSQEVLAAVREAIPEAGQTPRAFLPQDMPVVALTAHAMSGDREYFLRMGMDMYLTKPIMMDELYLLLNQVGKGRRASALGPTEAHRN